VGVGGVDANEMLQRIRTGGTRKAPCFTDRQIEVILKGGGGDGARRGSENSPGRMEEKVEEEEVQEDSGKNRQVLKHSDGKSGGGNTGPRK